MFSCVLLRVYVFVCSDSSPFPWPQCKYLLDLFSSLIAHTGRPMPYGSVLLARSSSMAPSSVGALTRGFRDLFSARSNPRPARVDDAIRRRQQVVSLRNSLLYTRFLSKKAPRPAPRPQCVRNSRWKSKDRRQGLQTSNLQSPVPLHKPRGQTMQSITALALLLATTFADSSRAGSWRQPSLLRRSFRRLNHPRRTTATFDDTASSTTAATPGSTRSGIGGRVPSPLHNAVFCTRGGDGGNGPCIGIDLGESRLVS